MVSRLPSLVRNPSASRCFQPASSRSFAASCGSYLYADSIDLSYATVDEDSGPFAAGKTPK